MNDEEMMVRLNDVTVLLKAPYDQTDISTAISVVSMVRDELKARLKYER